ncbi:MAG: hypothetical protein GY912_02020, partial [Candidatus Marinimicrobia bacterium]|nr:hypothetical protein [Candidatus Neomarinimicrobiota bacterium]
VEMDPCMMTSRIKQANGAIQLFVQRTMMGLEKEIQMDEDARQEWKWRKNYRVWEANRKVFLYPENWIEPELRDDKTSFFKELETELLQNEINDETVETAFVNYLYKLDEVAQLNLVGMYHDLNENTIHVFGRTHSEPYICYYRRREGTNWTPWEKMELDIEGDHLIPVVWNRRLYLFWAVFNKVAGEEWGGETTEDWEIKLAWSEYKKGKWAPKKLHDGAIASKAIKILENPQYYHDYEDQSKSDHYPLYNPRVALDGVVRKAHGGEVTKADESELRLSNENQKQKNQTIYFSVELSNLPLQDDHIFFIDLSPGKITISCVREDHRWLLGGRVVAQSLTNYINGEQVHSDKLEFKAKRFTLDLRKNYKVGKFEIDTSILKMEAVQAPDQNVFDNKKLFIPKGSTHNFMEWRSSKIPLQFNDASFLTLKPSDFECLKTNSGFSFPFFYQDQSKSFFVHPISVLEKFAKHSIPGIPDTMPGETISDPYVVYDEMLVLKFQFHTFYHHFVCEFITRLNEEGVSKLLSRETQGLPEFAFYGPLFLVGYSENAKDFMQIIFDGQYKPNKNVVANPYPIEDVSFKSEHAYAAYNWELFFHIPLLIADRLHKNQRFEEALQWYHYVFDPKAEFSDFEKKLPVATSHREARFWKTMPLFNNMDAKESLLEIMALLHVDDPGSPLKNDPVLDQKKKELEALIKDWQADPFKPHLIARSRYSAYKKNVVMKYLDTLIAWGDQLFRRDTIESLNEAT